MSEPKVLPFLEWMHMQSFKLAAKRRANPEDWCSESRADFEQRQRSLMRPPRRIPPLPTQRMLKAALEKYGIRRKSAARMMGCSLENFNRYCLPIESKNRRRIPLCRWQMLLVRIQELNHPQYEVEL